MAKNLELKISSRTRNYLIKNYQSNEEVMKVGRIAAYECDLGLLSLHDLPKWKQELVLAMKKKDLIRPAETFTLSFNVAMLYKAVFGEKSHKYVTSIKDLSGLEYENFRSFSEGEILGLKLALHDQLTKCEFLVICRRFGLSKKNTIAELSKYLGLSKAHVRDLEMQALKKLRVKNDLPDLFGQQDEFVGSLAEQLDSLHEYPF